VTINATPGDRQLALTPLEENIDHVRGAPAGRPARMPPASG